MLVPVESRFDLGVNLPPYLTVDKATFLLGAGADALIYVGINSKSVTVAGDTGDDDVQLSLLAADELNVQLGDGSDRLMLLDDVFVIEPGVVYVVAGGNGVDRLRYGKRIAVSTLPIGFEVESQF